jgi:hypothetical protein
VIRLEHRSLPAGLSAVARRGERGDLTIVVSSSLDPGHQRAAVRAALRAARRHDWRLGLLPLPALIFMSGARSAASKLGHLLRAHAIVTAAAATATAGVVAAGVLVFAAPASHVPSGALSPGQPGYQLSPGASQPTSPGRTHARTRPGASAPSHVGATGPGVVAVVTPTSGPRPTPSPQPSPSESTSSPPSGPTPGPSPSSSTPTSQPSPTATPSSSPTGGSGGGGTCIELLGVIVCL